MRAIVAAASGRCRRVRGVALCAVLLAAGSAGDPAPVRGRTAAAGAAGPRAAPTAAVRAADAAVANPPAYPAVGAPNRPAYLDAAAPSPPGCPPAVTAAPDPSRLPVPPAGATVTVATPTPACTYAVGYATVHKMHEAVVVNDPRRSPAFSSVAVNARLVSAPGYFEVDSVGLFDFPDSSSTTLAFGFMPITARIQFSAQPATVVTVKKGTAPATSTIGYTQTIRVYDVRLNGTALDVGSGCRTSAPVETVLTGTAPAYNVLGGGPLAGHVDIPAFTGCRTPGGEDLDPLITASISGPGNVLDIRQGAVCTSQNGCAGTPVPALPTS